MEKRKSGGSIGTSLVDGFRSGKKRLGGKIIDANGRSNERLIGNRTERLSSPPIESNTIAGQRPCILAENLDVRLVDSVFKPIESTPKSKLPSRTSGGVLFETSPLVSLEIKSNGANRTTKPHDEVRGLNNAEEAPDRIKPDESPTFSVNLKTSPDNPVDESTDPIAVNQSDESIGFIVQPIAQSLNIDQIESYSTSRTDAFLRRINAGREVPCLLCDEPFDESKLLQHLCEDHFGIYSPYKCGECRFGCALRELLVAVHFVDIKHRIGVEKPKVIGKINPRLECLIRTIHKHCLDAAFSDETKRREILDWFNGSPEAILTQMANEYESNSVDKVQSSVKTIIDSGRGKSSNGRTRMARTLESTVAERSSRRQRRRTAEIQTHARHELHRKSMAGLKNVLIKNNLLKDDAPSTPMDWTNEQSATPTIPRSISSRLRPRIQSDDFCSMRNGAQGSSRSASRSISEAPSSISGNSGVSMMDGSEEGSNFGDS